MLHYGSYSVLWYMTGVSNKCYKNGSSNVNRKERGCGWYGKALRWGEGNVGTCLKAVHVTAEFCSFIYIFAVSLKRSVSLGTSWEGLIQVKLTFKKNVFAKTIKNELSYLQKKFNLFFS